MAALPPGIEAVPTWLFWTFVGGTILSMFLIALILIILLWTPAAAFLKAKMKNLPIFLMSGRDGMGGFFVPQFSENQYAHFNKSGTYAITRESFIFDRKSKQPIYIADKDIGASINKEWPKILEQLKDKFRKLKTGRDYLRIIEDAEQNKIDLLKNPELILKGATIKVNELSKFFPMNIKPTYIDEYAMIAVRRDRRKQNTLQFWAVMAVVIIAVGIAGYMIIDKVNEGHKPVSCGCDCGNVVEKVCGLSSLPGIEKANGTMQVIQEVPAPAKPGATLS